MVLVVWVSLMPGAGGGSGFVERLPWGDKVGHAVMYAGVSLALAYALLHWDLPVWWEAGGIFVVACTFGFLVEGVQAFVPYRVFSWGDAVANAVGASVVFGWYAVVPRLPRRRLGRARGRGG